MREYRTSSHDISPAHMCKTVTSAEAAPTEASAAIATAAAVPTTPPGVAFDTADPRTFTILAEPAEPGAVILVTVDDAEQLAGMGFAAGTLVVVNHGGDTEEELMVSSLGSLHLIGPCAFAHAAGEIAHVRGDSLTGL